MSSVWTSGLARTEPRSDDYVQAIAATGLRIYTLLDVPGREVTGGFVSELLRENFVDVNFALIVLAQKA